jgi:hypothetical protein
MRLAPVAHGSRASNGQDQTASACSRSICKTPSAGGRPWTAARSVARRPRPPLSLHPHREPHDTIPRGTARAGPPADVAAQGAEVALPRLLRRAAARGEALSRHQLPVLAVQDGLESLAQATQRSQARSGATGHRQDQFCAADASSSPGRNARRGRGGVMGRNALHRWLGGVGEAQKTKTPRCWQARGAF